MTETAPPQPIHASSLSSGTRPLWQPILLRALVTVAFGLLTVFWANPGTLGLSLGIAGYFLAVAASHYMAVRCLALPVGDTSRVALLGATGLIAVSGVVAAISLNPVVVAWLAGAALAAMGGAELFAGLRKPAGSERGRPPLRSDWIISGVLGLGTGLLLPFFAAAGPHALLGVTGGGALMSGALWTLSALTLRHDSSKSKAA